MRLVSQHSDSYHKYFTISESVSLLAFHIYKTVYGSMKTAAQKLHKYVKKLPYIPIFHVSFFSHYFSKTILLKLLLVTTFPLRFYIAGGYPDACAFYGNEIH